MKEYGRHRKWEKSHKDSSREEAELERAGKRRPLPVGRRVTAMEVQVRRKRGGPKRRWLDRMTGDINENGLSVRECTTEIHGHVYIVEHRPLT